MRITCEGFLQEYLVHLKLTAADAYVLRWFLSFSQSGKQDFIDKEDKRFHWVKYSKVVQDLPILYIKNEIVVGNLFRKLCGQGQPNESEYPLEKINVWDSKRNKVYFRFKPEILEIMESTRMDNIFGDPMNDKPIKDKDYRKIAVNDNALAIWEKAVALSIDEKPVFNHASPVDDHHYTKVYGHFQDMMLALYEGKFLTQYPLSQIDPWFKEKYKYYLKEDTIISGIRNCKGNWKETTYLIEQAIKTYALWFNVTSEQQDKTKLPRNINTFMYDAFNKISMFYVCLVEGPTSQREAQAEKTYDTIKPEYRKIFTSLYQDSWDGFTYWNKIRGVIKWYETNAKEMMGKDSNCIYWLNGGVKEFLNDYRTWILDLTDDQPHLNNFGIKNKTWNWYTSEKAKQHQIETHIPKE